VLPPGESMQSIFLQQRRQFLIYSTFILVSFPYAI